MTQRTLFYLHLNKYIAELRYNRCAANFDRFVGRCNTLSDLSNKSDVPNKTEDLDLSIFNMLTEINKPKILSKKYDVNVNVNFTIVNAARMKSEIMINVSVS